MQLKNKPMPNIGGVVVFGLKKTNMTIVQLQGGLGNQIFQYAAALVATKGNQKEIVVDASYYWYVPNRRYILDKLQLPAQKISFFSHPLEFFLALPVIGERWKKMYSKIGPFQLVTEKKQFYFYKTLSKKKANIYLSGFWQHRLYLDEQKKKLLKLIVFPPITNAKKKRVYRKILQKKSVAIHVRRGDYLRNSNFGLCSMDYYLKGMKYISSHVRKPQYFIFSDDIAWCKKEFKKIKNCIFIEDTQDEITDLLLMKSCKHHIIANSTFSWLGAWLHQKKGIVIAPKNWSGNKKAASALLYPRWKKI
jgi:hypothetical protein